MLYHEVEGQIQDGDFLFFRGTVFYSRVIQRWTKSRYSHVAVAVRIRESLFVLEAVEGRGVRLFPLSMYLRSGCKIDWFKIIDPRVDREKVTQWFLDRVGNNYASPRQLIRSFLTLPFANALDWSTKIDNNRWFCSFAGVEALRHGYGELADKIIPNEAELASPGDVSYIEALHIQGTLKWKEE